jgi:ribonuclease HII
MPRDSPARPQVPPPPAPTPTWTAERAAWAEGWVRVAGVDEAGRGPLAGPVVAAAAILPREAELPGVLDSKCLDAAAREALYEVIRDRAIAWAVAVVDVEEIDRVNILRATHAAMSRALAQIEPLPCGALVDGMPVTGLPCPHRAIVDGDALSVSIAAASILAKVTRDRLMVDLDERYPGYGFARHKGYCTPAHFAALRRLGPSPIHRRSFAPVAAYFSGQTTLALDDERDAAPPGG